MKLDTYLIPYIKINFKCIKDLKYRSKSLWPGLPNGFLYMTSKTQATKGYKIDQFDIIKIIFLWFRGCHQESENVTRMGENFANNVSDKEFVSRISKELLQLNNKMTYSNLKWEKDLNRSNSGPKEYIQMTNKHMKKVFNIHHFTIQKMQIKATLRYHFTNTNITIITNKLKTENKSWQGCGKFVPTHAACGNVK